MPSPCNNLNVVPIKVSKLVRYQNLDANDFFLTVESGSSLTSRRSTLADLKNALSKLTGSYTGSYLGQFSGSFTGSFKGKLSGSFSGSHYGKFIGKNASVSGSFSGSFYGVSNFTKTASYLKKTTSNLESTIPYYDSAHLTSTANNNSYGGLFWSSNGGGYNLLKMSSSVPTNYIIVDSKATNNFGQSHLILSNNCNRAIRVPAYNWGPEGWDLFSNNSGSLILNSLTGSYQFSNNVYTAGGKYPYFSALKQVRNNFYFWADPPSYSSVCRDGAIGIGVSAPNTPTGSFGSYLKAKLHIDMFSASAADIGKGSWGNATGVEHRHTAILVRYGSGSAVTGLNTTFYVSSSGNTLVGGKLNVSRGITGSLYGTGFRTLNSKTVSFWGTGSHAVSSSYSTVASTASYISTGGGDIFANAYYVQKTGAGTPVNTGTSNTFGNIVVPAGKKLKWFKIEGSFNVSENNGVQVNGVSLNGTLVSSNVYSSWGWQKSYYYNPDSGDVITHFTIEGAPPAAVTTGTISIVVHTTNTGTNTCNGYAVGYF